MYFCHLIYSQIAASNCKSRNKQTRAKLAARKVKRAERVSFVPHIRRLIVIIRFSYEKAEYQIVHARNPLVRNFTAI